MKLFKKLTSVKVQSGSIRKTFFPAIFLLSMVVLGSGCGDNGQWYDATIQGSSSSYSNYGTNPYGNQYNTNPYGNQYNVQSGQCNFVGQIQIGGSTYNVSCDPRNSTVDQWLNSLANQGAVSVRVKGRFDNNTYGSLGGQQSAYGGSFLIENIQLKNNFR